MRMVINKYLREMLANMEDVDDGDQKEYIKKFINIFFFMFTSFIPIILREIE